VDAETGASRNLGTCGVVVIGRNEGERLLRCLDSIRGHAAAIVYVDSGSADASVEAARARGAAVVSLDAATPFTAARARNRGFDRLLESGVAVDRVQFVDGDCEIVAGWWVAANEFIDAHRDVAAVCGRRRERFPGRSIYNRLCDMEWDTPIGEARACGGDVLMRVEAFRQAGGFRESLIAGEEPELCLRLRSRGWRVWRLDIEMTLHDAAMTRFSQWWRRSKRAGFAFAEGASLHGRTPERHWVRETRSAWIWGAAIPTLIVIGLAIFGPLAAWGLAIYPLQVLRLTARGTGAMPDRALRAVFLVLGKFAEASGALAFLWRRLRGGEARLIEYK
jgi:GT2 family glycosyltransferase